VDEAVYYGLSQRSPVGSRDRRVPMRPGEFSSELSGAGLETLEGWVLKEAARECFPPTSAI